MAMRWMRAAILAFGIALLAAACHENATVFVVDTTTDSVDANPGDGLCADAGGDCSLRAAIMEANALPGVEKIQLAPATTYTLSLAGAGEDLAATGDLDITEGVVIVGDGTIDAAGIDRVLDLHHVSGLVELEGPNLTGGSAPDGSAVRAAAAGITSILDADIVANTASAGSPVSASAGSIYLWDSSITSNTGTAAGGVGVSGGSVNGRNLTISGNTGGPGLVGSGGTTVLAHATITDNAGGISGAGGSIGVGSSLVVAQATGDDCSGSVSSAGHNIESAETCGFDEPSDLQNATPSLAPLALNGGEVLSHLPGGVAINGATTAACAGGADVRGVARPNGWACDVGAVEVAGLGADCGSPGPAADLRFCDLSGQNLTLTDLSGADLRGADLSGAILALTDFSGALLDGATFASAQAADTDFTSAITRGTVFDRATLTRPVLTGVDLAPARLHGVAADQITTGPAAIPPRWALHGGRLVGRGVELNGVDLSGADLTGVDLADAELAGADLLGSTVTDLRLAAAATDGLRAGNLVGTPATLPTDWFLTSAWLVGPGAVLDGASFLTSDELENRNLSSVVFDGANLRDMTFDGSDLSFADLTGANVINADIRFAADLWRLRALDVNSSIRRPPGYVHERSALWGPGMDMTGFGNTGGTTTLFGADLTDADLSGITPFRLVLTNVTAVRTDFSGMVADKRFVATNTDLTDAVFVGADLVATGWNDGTEIVDSDLTGSDFTNARFGGEQFSIAGSTIDGTIFTGSDFSNLFGWANTGSPVDVPGTHVDAGSLLYRPGVADQFHDVDVSGFDLTGIEIPGTWFNLTAVGTTLTDTSLGAIRSGDLRNADFTGARIPELRSADIDGATFTGADFRDIESSLLTGTPAALPTDWWLETGHLVGPWADVDVSGPLDLSNRNLSGANFTGTQLRTGIDFTNSNLTFVDFRGATAIAADFTNANLVGADLAGAILTGATWSSTVCPDGTLSSANGNTCVGVDPVNHWEVIYDPTGVALPLAGAAQDLGFDFIRPTLTYVQGATIIEVDPNGVDWYIDDVLYRDNDFLAPFEIRSAQPLLTGQSFNGQGAGSGTTFFIDVGIHTVRAEAVTTAGNLTFESTFRIDEP